MNNFNKPGSDPPKYPSNIVRLSAGQR